MDSEISADAALLAQAESLLGVKIEADAQLVTQTQRKYLILIGSPFLAMNIQNYPDVVANFNAQAAAQRSVIVTDWENVLFKNGPTDDVNWLMGQAARMGMLNLRYSTNYIVVSNDGGSLYSWDFFEDFFQALGAWGSYYANRAIIAEGKILFQAGSTAGIMKAVGTQGLSVV